MNDKMKTPEDKQQDSLVNEQSLATNSVESSALAACGIPGLGLISNAPKSIQTSSEHEMETVSDKPASADSVVPMTASNVDHTADTPMEESSVEGKDQSWTAEEKNDATSAPPVDIELPGDLLGLLEATITGGEKDAEMLEPSAQPSNLSLPAPASSQPGLVESTSDHMEVEVSKGDEPATEEPVEVVDTEIENGEVAMKERPELQERPVNPDTEAEAAAPGEHPEWEVDSSPYESSSDDSSSDSSSDDSEGEDAYKLLDPEEQARILMEGDGGSDDEGGNKGAKGSGGQLRTKNEVPEEVIPKPDVIVTPEMKIEELGAVEGVVENTVLIKAKISGEYRVLEGGSVLCLEDRTVIGVVAETIGRVQQPFYSVRFTNATGIAEAGLSMGTKVFYSEQHSTYVFTQALKAYKGSDASNLHDEEVGDDEIEFSDDEAEAEHKRRVKQKKLERRGGKVQQNGGQGRGGHPLQQQHSSAEMNYDDDEDGPYKPLARPAGFAENVGRMEAPQETGYQFKNDRPSRGGHDRGRGRGDRGRGRGRGNDRGRGRGGFSQAPRRDDSQGHPSASGYQAPRDSTNNQQQASTFPPNPLQAQGFPMPFPPPPPNFYTNPQNPPAYSPNQPGLWPPFPPQLPFQQQQQQQQQPQQQQQQQQQHQNPQFPQPYTQPGWQNNAAGAYINPAFFGGAQGSNQWNPQGQNQGGQGGNGT
ncbi:H/ACA ribonucleoprotein complex non-core subunit NAF1 [Phlyctema vagabunda]|uniref:H/ACA ribonucleoprotein complex non-core subunit NAF1 n=1 Tax=Phlyctema vagabunda TaxID=108571 RepID=A0ABR4PW69_9HELO